MRFSPSHSRKRFIKATDLLLPVLILFPSIGSFLLAIFFFFLWVKSNLLFVFWRQLLSIGGILGRVFLKIKRHHLKQTVELFCFSGFYMCELPKYMPCYQIEYRIQYVFERLQHDWSNLGVAGISGKGSFRGLVFPFYFFSNYLIKKLGISIILGGLLVLKYSF